MFHQVPSPNSISYKRRMSWVRFDLSESAATFLLVLFIKLNIYYAVGVVCDTPREESHIITNIVSKSR
jgi:hypothetical protein